MRIALIWAEAENGVIGRAGGLPWHLPDEMRHFVACTRGKPVIVGRRTFEGFAKPLPGRTNIVVTGNPAWRRDGVQVAGDLAGALAMAGEVAGATGVDECCVIGGSALYASALPLAGRLYRTVVHARPDGDVRFPDFDRAPWRVTFARFHPADARHAHAFTVATLEPVDRAHG